jgi:hypothetical protein
MLILKVRLGELTNDQYQGEIMFRLMHYLFITAIVVAMLALPVPVAAEEVIPQSGFKSAPTATASNSPPLTLDDPGEAPTFDEEDPEELGDGECIL